ncbi:MAG TPA: SDR family NAD(P)-dependent oxidoreductase [Solirubrobacteraceae bacterium]|nr:SDR family NAD(P)-dependent oxidoreductase [Solirubrobacteraceae bacterium]
MSDRFFGRVAVVTGGAAGIGLATARAFKAEGATVVIVDFDEHGMAASATELGVDSVRADVTSEADVTAMFAVVLERHGKIDILVNLAGIYPAASIEEETLAGWKHLIEVNLDSTFLCCKHALAPMRKRRYGRIVNISSGTVNNGAPGLPAYVATKAGVIGLSRVLSREAGPDGVTVNVMMPGLIPTDTALNAFGEGAATDVETSPIFANAIAHQSIKRAGTAEDIAHGILFLCEERSSWMTGQTLQIDGGWHFT